MNHIAAQEDTAIRHKPQTPVEKQTERLKALLPEGITMGRYADGRGKPYFVRHGKDRSAQAYADEKARNVRVEELLLQREQHGSVSLDFRASELAEIQRFMRETGATPDELRAAWARYVGARKFTLLTKEAVDRYLVLRVSEGVDIKSNTYRQMKKHLVKCLAATFGERPLAEITAEELRAVLSQVKNRDGSGIAAPITKRSYLKHWKTFFRRATAEKWLPENPCEVMKSPRVFKKTHKVLAIEVAFRFLRANISEPVTPRIALEMWGFARASWAARAAQDDIRLQARALRMKGEDHKSEAQKYRSGHSPVLWDWLALGTDATWEMTEKQYADRKAEAITRAGISRENRNMHNILRHSCISYLLTETKNPPLVCYLAQHTNLEQTLDYEGCAEERDAKLWSKLTPQAVRGTWEEFLAANSEQVSPCI